MALARTPESIRFIGERLPAPLVLLCPAGGLHALDGMSEADLGGLGFNLLCDAQTALLAQYHAAQGVYAAMARNRCAPPPAGQTWRGVGDAIHDTIDIETLLAVERDTVEGKY